MMKEETGQQQGGQVSGEHRQDSMEQQQGEGERYVCRLSPALQEKARRELNEDPATRHLEIQAFRERILKYQGLNARVDDEFLLRFLRAKKFNQERAFQILLNFYKVRRDHPDVFECMLPSSVREALQDGVLGVLPHRDRQGRRVILSRPGRWNTEKYTLMALLKMNYMTLWKLLEDEETQVCGFTSLQDMQHCGWEQLKQVTPSMLRKLAAIIQNSFPGRFKGDHYVHEPSIFNKVYNLIKQFLNDKFRSRMWLHGEKVEELRDFIDPDVLPSEYGGNAAQYTNEHWTSTLLAAEEEFQEDSKFGFVPVTAVGDKDTSQDAIHSVTGTFRPLSDN